MLKTLEKPQMSLCSFRRLFKPHRQTQIGQRGALMVETVVSLPLFLLLIVGLIEISRLSYTALTLQYTLNRASRWAVVGEQPPDPLMTRTDYVIARMIEVGQPFGLHLQPSEITICPANQPGCFPSDAGGANDFVVYSAQKPLQLFAGFSNYTVKSTVLAKNEPF